MLRAHPPHPDTRTQPHLVPATQKNVGTMNFLSANDQQKIPPGKKRHSSVTIFIQYIWWNRFSSLPKLLFAHLLGHCRLILDCANECSFAKKDNWRESRTYKYSSFQMVVQPSRSSANNITSSLNFPRLRKMICPFNSGDKILGESRLTINQILSSYRHSQQITWYSNGSPP